MRPTRLGSSSEQRRLTTLPGEVAPSEHFLQLYEDDGVILDALEGFAAGGLEAGDGVIVIATAAHLTALAERLAGRGVRLSIVRAQDQYITLDAEEALAKFMVDGWPDQDLFEGFVSSLVARARGIDRRHVRAFGEMVAIMWGRGLNRATVRLEHLWQTLCHREKFSLFCAYPRSGFTEDDETSMREICAAHSRVLAS